MYDINYMYEISLNSVLSNVCKVLVIFVTDIPTSGIHGFNALYFHCIYVFICKPHGKFIKYSYFQVQADGAKACIVFGTYCTVDEFSKEKKLRTVVVSYYCI